MKQIHKKIVLSISFLGTVIAPIPVFTVSCSNKSSLKSDSLAAKHAAIEAKKKEAKAAKVKVNHSASTTSATSNNTTAADNSNKHTLKINPTTDGSHIIVNSNTYSRSTYNKQIEHGKRVEIQTIPDDGLIFDKWSDGCVQNPRILRVNDDIELTAHFIEKPTDVVKKNTITYNNKEYELVDYIDPNVFSTDGSLNLILNDNWQHLKIAAQDKDGITALSLHTCNQHVDFIGDNFLSHCHNLQKLDISDLEQIVTIGDKFLYWCDSFNSEYKLPNSVQQIGDCFMKFCTKFNQRLEMPEMLFLLGKSPFYGCDALDVKRKVINNQWNVLCRNVIVVGDEQYDLVDDIDPNVFSNLDTCNTWSYFWTAFGRCWGYLFASAFSALLTPLRELTSPLKNIFGYTSVWKYTGHFTTDDIIDLEIPLLDGTKKRVARDGIRSLQLLSCDPKVKKIEDNFLFHCISLEWLDLYGLNNIESVGNNFLSLCSKLNCPLQFPSSLKSIGNCFMRQCDSYNQPIVMPDEITHMSDSFMAGCHSFNTTLTLPKKLKTIGVGFLGWCDSMMHKVIVPEGVTSIGSYFMYDCHVFNCTPNLPKTLKSIGDHFMSACYLFNRNTVLPDSLESIGSQFLEDCHSFNSKLVIPKSVKEIGAAFMFRRTCFDESKLINNSNVEIDWGRTLEEQQTLEFIMEFFFQALSVELGVIADDIIMRQEIERIYGKNYKKGSEDERANINSGKLHDIDVGDRITHYEDKDGNIYDELYVDENDKIIGGRKVAKRGKNGLIYDLQGNISAFDDSGNLCRVDDQGNLIPFTPKDDSKPKNPTQEGLNSKNGFGNGENDNGNENEPLNIKNGKQSINGMGEKDWDDNDLENSFGDINTNSNQKKNQPVFDDDNDLTGLNGQNKEDLKQNNKNNDDIIGLNGQNNNPKNHEEDLKQNNKNKNDVDYSFYDKLNKKNTLPSGLQFAGDDSNTILRDAAEQWSNLEPIPKDKLKETYNRLNKDKDGKGIFVNRMIGNKKALKKEFVDEVIRYNKGANDVPNAKKIDLNALLSRYDIAESSVSGLEDKNVYKQLLNAQNFNDFNNYETAKANLVFRVHNLPDSVAARKLPVINSGKDADKILDNLCDNKNTEGFMLSKFIKNDKNEIIGVNSLYLDQCEAYNSVCKQFGLDPMDDDVSALIQKFGVYDIKENVKIDPEQYYKNLKTRVNENYKEIMKEKPTIIVNNGQNNPKPQEHAPNGDEAVPLIDHVNFIDHAKANNPSISSQISQVKTQDQALVVYQQLCDIGKNGAIVINEKTNTEGINYEFIKGVCDFNKMVSEKFPDMVLDFSAIKGLLGKYDIFDPANPDNKIDKTPFLALPDGKITNKKETRKIVIKDKTKLNKSISNQTEKNENPLVYDGELMKFDKNGKLPDNIVGGTEAVTDPTTGEKRIRLKVRVLTLNNIETAVQADSYRDWIMRRYQRDNGYIYDENGNKLGLNYEYFAHAKEYNIIARSDKIRGSDGKKCPILALPSTFLLNSVKIIDPTTLQEVTIQGIFKQPKAK